jgi:hypothetical protein
MIILKLLLIPIIVIWVTVLVKITKLYLKHPNDFVN